MKTYSRICIKDYTIKAENGDTATIKRGKEYLTTPVMKNGTVIVFTNYWFPVPVEHFAGEEIFTKA